MSLEIQELENNICKRSQGRATRANICRGLHAENDTIPRLLSIVGFGESIREKSDVASA